MRVHKALLQAGAAGLAAAMLPHAAAIECTPPPATVTRDYQTKIDFAVAKVLAVRGPGATVEVKTQASNLLDKLPGADKALVELSYLHALCTALRDDRSMPEAEKAKAIASFARPAPPRPATAPAKPANAGAPAPAATQPIHVQGNSGTTVVGNQAGRDVTVNANGNR